MRALEKRGRLLPEGLTYIDSWLIEGRRLCFQLMETEDPALLDEWMGRWNDLCEFEVHPVLDEDA